MSGLARSLMQQAVRNHQQGAMHEAIRLYRAVLVSVPRQTDAMNLLGAALVQVGRLEEAETSVRQALALMPDTPPYLANLGFVLTVRRRFAEAVACLRKAVQLKPDYVLAWSNLGNVLREQNEFEAAEEACRTALRLNPEYGEAHANLGTVLWQLGYAAKAAACYRKALTLMPGRAPLLAAYSLALHDLRQLDEAERHARDALRLAPADPQVRYALALICLLTGRDAEGWALFEARLELPEELPRIFTVPRWMGQPTSMPVLLHAEQSFGFGDTIQFCRFAAEAAKRTRVVLEAPTALHRLLRTLEGPEVVLSPGDPSPPLGAHLPLMSLPLLLGVERARFAAPVPYLRADTTLRGLWRARLAGSTGRRIGLAWAGNAANTRDRNRSIPFALLDPLLRLPGMCFVSLQKGPARAQIQAGALILDLTDEIDDFADTAALIAELDLVICVDTAVAHLAGALGHPVWVLNRFDTDWRWELGTDASSWYPGLRQFRQPAPGDWSAVIGAVTAALARGPLESPGR